MGQIDQGTDGKTKSTTLRQIFFSPYSALTITMFCWAATTVIVRYVREDIPPMGLSFWRNVIAFLMLLPFAIKPLCKHWADVCRHWKIFSLLSLLLWVGGNALLFLSLQYTIAINAAVINSIEPLLIVLFAWLLFRDPFSVGQGIGLLISLGGVIVLIAAGSLERLLNLDFNQGDLIVTGAYISWSLYAVILRKVPSNVDHRAIAVVILGLGALFLAPIYFLETLFYRPVQLNGTSVITILVVALIASAIPMILWNYSIMRLGPARAGQFLHLIPAFTVVMAIAVLNETLGMYHITGIVLIALGLIIAARR